jgi:restriction system protein
VPDDGFDRLPTFELSPEDYELAVADLVKTCGQEVADWQVKHLDPVDGLDGTYVIDVTVRFRIFGADFLTLFECKRHASPVKREHVQVLRDKLVSTGAQKGVVVAASGFQSGALSYAKAHRIACVRLLDSAWNYESRNSNIAITPSLSGQYTAYANYMTTVGGLGSTLLSNDREYACEHLFGSSPVK